MNVYELLSRNNYITLNKPLVNSIGLSEAALLSEICYRHQYLERAGKLTEDGFFYVTIQDVQSQLPFSDYEQKKILDKFQRAELVIVERRGLPAKRYIKIIESNLQLLMDLVTCEKKFPVPENFRNLLLNDSVLNSNNTNNNQSSDKSSLSEDRVSDSSPSSNSETSSSSEISDERVLPSNTKPVSGKLVSSPRTRKSVTQKVNSFITMCEREANLKGYSQRLKSELQKFFIMLGETNTLLPQTTIREQLAALDKLSEENRVEAVVGTLQHGWKSLIYMCDELSGKNKKKNDPAFIGNSQPKDINAPRISRQEQLKKAIENGEEVF